MKIEIELVEVEALRNQVNQLARENQELREEIENISPEKLKARAARLAHKIADDYVSAIFCKIGFSNEEFRSIIINDNLEHWIGKEWWNSEKISIVLGAEVTKMASVAFLKIGIITEDIMKAKQITHDNFDKV